MTLPSTDDVAAYLDDLQSRGIPSPAQSGEMWCGPESTACDGDTVVISSSDSDATQSVRNEFADQSCTWRGGGPTDAPSPSLRAVLEGLHE